MYKYFLHDFNQEIFIPEKYFSNLLLEIPFNLRGNGMKVIHGVKI